MDGFFLAPARPAAFSCNGCTLQAQPKMLKIHLENFAEIHLENFAEIFFFLQKSV